MIDPHCHILPNIDDGPRTMAQSLAIAKSLAASGYRHVIATPHSMDGIYNSDPVDIHAKTFALNQELRRASIKLTVYPGAEYPLTPELLNADLVTLNRSRYLLVELPFNQPIPNYATDIFFQLQARGLTPILAHPERCSGIQEDPEAIRAYIKLGVLTQVNIASFFGRFGSRAKELVIEWSENNLVHFLATDCHRPLKHDLAKLKQYIHKTNLDKYQDSSWAVLHNKDFLPSTPKEQKPKTTLQRVAGALLAQTRFR